MQDMRGWFLLLQITLCNVESALQVNSQDLAISVEYGCKFCVSGKGFVDEDEACEDCPVGKYQQK